MHSVLFVNGMFHCVCNLYYIIYVYFIKNIYFCLLLECKLQEGRVMSVLLTVSLLLTAQNIVGTQCRNGSCVHTSEE